MLNNKIINLLWVGLEKFGMTLISMATFFVYAKLLSTYEFGLGVLALSVGQSVAIMFGNLFEDALVQHKKPQTVHFNTAFWGGLVVSTALIISIALLIVSLNMGERLRWLMLLSLAHIILFSLSSIYVAQCRRASEFSTLAKRAVIARLAGALVGIVLAVKGFGAIAIVLQSLVFELVAFAYLFIRSKFVIKPLWDSSVLKQLLSIGWVLCLRRLSWDSATRGLPIILGAVAGPVAVGIYGFAWRLVEMPRSAIFSGLMSYGLPVFSRHQDNSVKITGLFLNSTRFTYLLLAPLFVGLASISPSLIGAVFGDKWNDAIVPTQILCLVAVISLSRIYAVICSTAVARPKTALLSDMTGTVFAISIAFLFGAEYGVYAAAIGMLIRSLVTFPFSVKGIQDIIGVSYRDQIKALLPTLIACAFMATMVYYAGAYWADMSPVALVVLQCLIGVLTYVLALFCIYPRWIKELKQFVYDE